ncbi:MAG: aldo/keto reductase [Phycisphaerae bacterium]
MESRAFGVTGLRCSVVGLGASHLEGDAGEAERLLCGALDAGVSLIDTARSYGQSEDRIGRFITRRRGEFLLSSKCGYGVEGEADWTGLCIAKGVDRALRTLGVAHIDIMHLHSCPLDVLRRDDVLGALEAARRAGKIRVAAYSGENDALRFAIASGQFGSVQTSVNVCDQNVLDDALPEAARRGLGMIAKRPLANAFWRFEKQPTGDYCEEYWRRAREMLLSPGSLAWSEFALRFAAHQPGVSAIIVGTSRLEHLLAAIRDVERGTLPADVSRDVRQRFATHGKNWPGQI